MTLSASDVEHFAEHGYLILPGFLSADLVSRLKPEVDTWVDAGHRAKTIACCVDPELHGVPPLLEFEQDAHGELVAHTPLMNALAQLMGPSFAFHHMHSDRQAPTLPGKAWHHDYEQSPQVDRAFTMVHTLHYLDGLDENTSSLAVLPGSHREVSEKTAFADRECASLPGEVVIEQLPKGSTVVVHSALFHTRRARPGGIGKPRYFVDASYCQAGVAWPQVKPFWRNMLRRARALDLDGGRWPELFAEHHFSEYVKAA